MSILNTLGLSSETSSSERKEKSLDKKQKKMHKDRLEKKNKVKSKRKSSDISQVTSIETSQESNHNNKHLISEKKRSHTESSFDCRESSSCNSNVGENHIKKKKSNKRHSKDSSSNNKKATLESEESNNSKLEFNNFNQSKNGYSDSSNKKIENLVEGRKYIPSGVEKFRKDNYLTIDDDSRLFDPILSFDELDFPKELLSLLSEFQKPTHIQSQCWPIGLAGRDLIGIAETGSGKTFAFILPILYNLMKQGFSDNFPQVLILCPTRELAIQIFQVLSKAEEILNIKSVCICGGMDKAPQIKALKKGVKMIVSTPGRLIDLMNNNNNILNLTQVKFFVLDEADRMLDLGFKKDIGLIAESLPSARQTMMFSATWPQEVRSIAELYLKNPVTVKIGKSDDLNANINVKQILEVIDPKLKNIRLKKLLNEYHDRKNRILIFVLYKKEATRVEEFIRRSGWNVLGIHSDKSQKDRSIAIEAFKSGKCPLLVATDVAARGLDIPNIEYIINYSFPLTIEDYIHRIGRTGRAGKSGIAHTFFTSFDKSNSGPLIQTLKQAGQPVPPELLKFGNFIKEKEPKLGSIDINSDAGVVKFSDSE